MSSIFSTINIAYSLTEITVHLALNKVVLAWEIVIQILEHPVQQCATLEFARIDWIAKKE